MLENVSQPADAAEVAKKIIARIGEVFAVDWRDLYLGASIAMAYSLGLEVIAEGVETREQYLFLRALRCGYAQGFHFSPPRPAADIPMLIRQGVASQA